MKFFKNLAKLVLCFALSFSAIRPEGWFSYCAGIASAVGLIAGYHYFFKPKNSFDDKLKAITEKIKNFEVKLEHRLNDYNKTIARVQGQFEQYFKENLFAYRLEKLEQAQKNNSAHYDSDQREVERRLINLEGNSKRARQANCTHAQKIEALTRRLETIEETSRQNSRSKYDTPTDDDNHKNSTQSRSRNNVAAQRLQLFNFERAISIAQINVNYLEGEIRIIKDGRKSDKSKLCDLEESIERIDRTIRNLDMKLNLIDAHENRLQAIDAGILSIQNAQEAFKTDQRSLALALNLQGIESRRAKVTAYDALTLAQGINSRTNSTCNSPRSVPTGTFSVPPSPSLGAGAATNVQHRSKSNVPTLISTARVITTSFPKVPATATSSSLAVSTSPTAAASTEPQGQKSESLLANGTDATSITDSLNILKPTRRRAI